jgi:uncharacterized protein YjiS (DUF1127 family)
MSATAHAPLTFPQPMQRAEGDRPNLPARIVATLRLWQRRMRERQDLLRLSPRELRDMRASSADVYWETSQPFWREARRR